MMRPIVRSRAGLITALIFILLLALIVTGVCWVNPKLTRFVESDRFRAELEKETAKGLHLENAHYDAIHRTGTWTAETADFQGGNGRKAIKAMEARDITAKFNPWGVFKRVWPGWGWTGFPASKSVRLI